MRRLGTGQLEPLQGSQGRHGSGVIRGWQTPVLDACNLGLLTVPQCKPLPEPARCDRLIRADRAPDVSACTYSDSDVAHADAVSHVQAGASTGSCSPGASQGTPQEAGSPSLGDIFPYANDLFGPV